MKIGGFLKISLIDYREKISSVGKIEDVPQADHDEIIDAEGGAILPGFVNAHTHVATECFRGIADVFPNRPRK